MEAPPEGLATDPSGPLPSMLEPDADALGERLAAALASALRDGARHAAGLSHLVGFVGANRGVSREGLAAAVREGRAGLEDLRK